ncbi:multifunctional protein ADE2 isoform X1 [Scomber scombrus]|nr:multifunctional protein ADE2 isoform X1 [Scomber scombrus]
MAGAMEERTCSSDSVSSISIDVTPDSEESALNTGNGHRLDQEHRLLSSSNTTATENADTSSANRGTKRKAVDQDTRHQTPAKKKVDTGHDFTDNMKSQCKEEQEHIPIIKISSVCSMASPNPSPDRQICRLSKKNMASAPELKVGQKLNEGKTKQIFELADQPGLVLVQSKDQITAGNAVRKDQMEGKAAIANRTTSCMFKLLQESGIKTAFVKQHSDTAFIAAHCEMIPIEWVCRRVATGSFLKRNPGVKEGYRFSPLKMEMFFKDDANNDPQWSEEQLLEAKFCLAGLTIGKCEVDIMNRSTVAIFEILERAWATQNCTLVDMKIEFGVNVKTHEIVLADVIDNDSWRLWPAGDRSQQKDKQVYRDLKEVTPEAMQMVKRNFEWVSERVKLLLVSQASGRVVVLMGSTSDMAHCEKIKKACTSYGIPCILRVTSAHKGPDETLRIKAEYEGDGVPTVFVAVAGRSNGLGPVMSGNTAYPVINCPPLTPDWGAQDVWSSLRMPSGLGCSTILSPDAAAQFAAQIFGLTDHLVWCKLRASMLNTWVSLKVADKKLQACSL